MDRETLLRYVAPCALLCYTCPPFVEGAICRHAAALHALFEGYHDFNDRNLPEEYRPWLEKTDTFLERLERYTHPGCPGCRAHPGSSTGCIEGCVVPACAAGRGVDFCADCPDFPCAKAEAFFATLNGVVGGDWLRGSQRIREIGLEAFFEEKRGVSHYISYKRPPEQ